MRTKMTRQAYDLPRRRNDLRNMPDVGAIKSVVWTRGRAGLVAPVWAITVVVVDEGKRDGVGPVQADEVLRRVVQRRALERNATY